MLQVVGAKRVTKVNTKLFLDNKPKLAETWREQKAKDIKVKF